MKSSDVSFFLTMVDHYFERLIDDYIAGQNGYSNIYVDTVVVSKRGGRVSIQGATVLHYKDNELDIIGGIYVLNENMGFRKDKYKTVDQSLQRFQNIDLED